MTLRDYKLSLYYAVQAIILPHYGYVETITGETLTNDADFVYSAANSNITYLDASGRLDQSLSIYDAGIELASDAYEVDYLDGTITLDALPSGTVTADYNFWTVNVIDAFPDADTFESADLPLVSIDIMEQTATPFSLGDTQQFWSVQYFIDIFATDDGTRLDMMDGIQQYLAKYRIPLIDFSDHMPLSYDGSINTSYDYDTQFSKWLVPHPNGKPKGSLLNTGTTSDKEKYRALVEGTLKDVH